MHPDQHFTPGTRVKVLRTADGYGSMHVGRTGTVVRRASDGYSSSPFGDLYFGTGRAFPRYIVQMDAPRAQEVIATALETIVADPAVKPGDRVRVVKTGRYGLGEFIDGAFGTLRETGASAGNPEALTVDLDEPRPTYAPRRAYVEQVEKVETVPSYDPATAAVGDRVVVTRQPRSEKIARNDEGKAGKVVKIDEPYTVGNEVHHRYYHVAVDGTTVKATKVSPLPALLKPKTPATGGRVDPAEKAEQEAAEAAAAPAEVPILVDWKRAQALKVAQEILGEFPDVYDLIKLASFVEGGTASTAEPTVVEVPKTPLVLEDNDGDTIIFDKAVSEEGASTIVTTGNDNSGTYIRDADVERVVAFLRAQRDR